MFQPNMFEAGQHNNLLLDHMSHQHKNSEENEADQLLIRDDDEFDTRSGGTDILENPSGDDDQDPNQHPNKKKRYHRHTQHQIQEMESFFKECPHPDDKQRKELGQRLGLEPLQVKFWFQNKRTQMKSQHERCENTQLRNENERLRAENIRCKEALNNATCPNCGGQVAIGEMSFEEQHLRIENARLREEIDKISAIAAKYVGKPMLSYTAHGQSGVPDMFGPGDFLRSVSGPSETDKPLVVELAVAAMEELIRMAQAGEPLWMRSTGSTIDQCLNEDEYLRNISRGIGPKLMGLNSEASRESAIVVMSHIELVEIMMDVNRWSNMFSSIISRAMTIEVLSTGVAGNYNGALQVMTAECQVPSPLVPTRENYFVRYCKEHDNGMWVIADVSLDNMRPGSISRYRRRPSGCLIQELPNGYSKVTWVEHVEVDDRSVHDMYRSLVNSGLAFGAKRWVTTLSRQCERLASTMANNIPAADVGVITTAEGRKSMLKLAERMVLSFCSGVGASTARTWTTLSGIGVDDHVRVMTRESIDDPGRPPGIVLSAATSFWIPVPPKRVFDFLRDVNSRTEWDILSNGAVVQEMAHTANGLDPGNCVSLLRVTGPNSSQSNMLIIQESWVDPTGSYVIYAPVDIAAMDMVLNGGDPDYVALLPSGFAILPDGPDQNVGGSFEVGSGGTLLTVGFQILVDSAPTEKLSLGSVTTVNNLIKCTMERIKSAVVFDQNV